MQSSVSVSVSVSISVVVPVYCSADCLPELAHRVSQELAGRFESFELILVNDDSPDKTWAVIQQLVRDLNLGLKLVVVPTVRDSDGLALSSRNVYLNAEELRAAPVVYRSLCRAGEMWERGERDAERLRQGVRQELKAEPLVAEIYYVSVADAATLEESTRCESQTMVSVAVKLGKPRLIDNIILD